ncbi:MAG: hypothetical protein ISR95_02515 [Candidatus Marinimicrobia bacterium]|nr:hypothetical protein [Candidatus Neomarinimicrobiota bacterium]
MFERQLQSLFAEITRKAEVFESLIKIEPCLVQFQTAHDLIDKFLESKDAIYQSKILNSLVQATRSKNLQQFCYLIIMAIFWRNIVFLSTSCHGRQITPEDLHSQASLILLEQVSKAARKERKEKLYINLTLNLRRDFFIWVKANDFDFTEIPESQEELDLTIIDTDKIIRRIIRSKVLSKSDVEFYLDINRDGRKVAMIAREKNVKPNSLRKKLQRIEKKMSRFAALKG